jgi:hypothetical protein
MTCYKCGGTMIKREEHFPECEDCGFVAYDQGTLALIAEVRCEFEQARRECWPEPVPSYAEWIRRAN